MAVPSLRFGSFGGCRVSWFRICGFLGGLGGLPRPPNYPLFCPNFQIPTIKDHKGSIEGPLGGSWFRAFGFETFKLTLHHSSVETTTLRP